MQEPLQELKCENDANVTGFCTMNLLGVYLHYGLHTRQVTDMTLYTGGFSRFVTSTTAPIATGWNESCRTGFAPAGKPCLGTAHKK
jgi:hypothetical protein